MSYAFKPAGADWIEVGENGTTLPGAGELGEPITVSHAFIESLSPETRTARGFVVVVNTDPPEGEVLGRGVEEVDGVPTRTWIVA